MSYTFKKDIIPSHKLKLKAPYSMVPEHYTVHNTANDATAQGEINYMSSNNNATSYHYAIDEKYVIQGIEENRNAFAAGDGSRGPGNRKSIHIEICYSKSGGPKYAQAEENAVQFLAYKLKQRGWGVDRVKKHQDWSGKYCPHRILADGRWNSFKQRVQKALDELNGKVDVTPVSKPVSSPSKAPAKVSGPDYNTNSIVDFLNSINESDSFSNRSRLAAKYGVSNYAGTASQNLNLLEKLKAAYKTPVKPAAKPAPKANTANKYAGGAKTDSIVDYLKSIGESSSFANRSRIAKELGISGYTGTASQNVQLLEKMRKGAAPKKAVNKYAGGNKNTDSVVDYLKSIGQSATFANRSRIAKELGIKGYEGTAAQNSQLLDKMRG